MGSVHANVTLAGSVIDCRCHVCAFFSSNDEADRVMLSFLKEGMDRGDKGVQILDGRKKADRVRRIESEGIDVAGAEDSGLLEFFPWEQAYLKPGRFDQDAMLELLGTSFQANRKSRSGITRLWANMEWALEDFPGVHDILEYESRVNDVLPLCDMATVCTYDLTKFSASLIMDMVRTHPYVIVGGILRQNPFYVPPEIFIAELKERRANGN
jgi:hypothetical protein